MVKENQASIGVEEAVFVRHACTNRQFDTEAALLQHCRNAYCHNGEWCERCEWLFVSPAAREQHLRDSSNHWICSKCGDDELEEANLRSHLKSKHLFCYDCELDFLDYEEHRIGRHNRCSICHEEYVNSNEVLMVSH